MAATKITDLAAFSQVVPGTDVMVGVDISDTTMDASGTDKKLTGDFIRYAVLSDIQGCALSYSSGTAIIVGTGVAGVNGKQVSFTQTTYTSGSTMKDIGNNTVTLGNSKAYLVFLSDGGVIGIEDFDTTGDGATPTFDTAFGYWKAASTGVAWRRIGKFFTSGAGAILKFIQTGRGRVRKFEMQYFAAIQLINATAQASYTSVTITPYCTADDTQNKLVTVGTKTGSAVAGCFISMDGGTSDYNWNYLSVSSSVDCETNYPHIWCPYTGTLHYKTPNTSSASIWLAGYEQYV